MQFLGDLVKHQEVGVSTVLRQHLSHMRDADVCRPDRSGEAPRSWGIYSPEAASVSRETLMHAGLVDLVKHHIYVGMADHTLAVLQHGTGLFLADLQRLTQDMFFQQVLI